MSYFTRVWPILALGGGGLSFVPPPTANTPSIVAVENAGLLFTDNGAGVSGTDAGYSIPLGKQTLWLFGDVFLLDPKHPRKTSAGAVSNCGLLVPSGKGPAPLKRFRFLTDGRTGLARELLSAEAGAAKEVRYWPFGGWHDAARRRIYLYHARVVTTGSGPLDFRTEGFGLAVAGAESPEEIRFRRITAGSGETWWKTAEGPAFGSAVCQAEGYLYVFGFHKDRDRTEGRVARVRPERIEEQSAYEYFTGSGWSARVGDSAAVAGLRDFPTELSVAYNGYLRKYLAVHSVGLQGIIRVSAAEQPWGPYIEIGDVGAPRRAFSRGFTYAGKEHPELAEAGGRVIYVTYVDSERYWLQLLRVTLKK